MLRRLAQRGWQLLAYVLVWALFLFIEYIVFLIKMNSRKVAATIQILHKPEHLLLTRIARYGAFPFWEFLVRLLPGEKPGVRLFELRN